MTAVARRSRYPKSAPRVLVIYKKSAYQIYVRERKVPRFRALLRQRHESIARLVRAHEAHVDALSKAKELLRALGARAVFRYRSDPYTAEGVDLVVTLGGDGTLLWASHFVGAHQPIVAINTAPEDSVGYFCAGTKHDLEPVLVGALRDALPHRTLTRMKVTREGRTLSSRVLNDVLFCHESPAATSRYTIAHGERVEEQKSSGLWVGPAAGSTAAQRSAGGRVLAPTSKQLQFVVREPYAPFGARPALVRGLIAPGTRLRVVSRMRNARVFIDGPRIVHSIEVAEELVFERSDESLRLLGFRR